MLIGEGHLREVVLVSHYLAISIESNLVEQSRRYFLVRGLHNLGVADSGGDGDDSAEVYIFDVPDRPAPVSGPPIAAPAYVVLLSVVMNPGRVGHAATDLFPCCIEEEVGSVLCPLLRGGIVDRRSALEDGAFPYTVLANNRHDGVRKGNPLAAPT